MNKKILGLIIFVILLVVGGIIFAVTLNNNNTNQTDNSNELVETNEENTATNKNSETNQESKINQNTSSVVSNETQNNNTTTTSGKSLILYFSQSGNTEKVANFIHESVGGDLVQLETVKTYKSNYNDLIDEAQEEQRNDERPELKTKIEIDEYDTIFLGYPNWWGDMPMPIYSFLDDYDLSGKTIAPFVTHGGSGLSGTPNKIKQAESGATVTEGLAVSGSSAGSSKSTVDSWLDKIGF